MNLDVQQGLNFLKKESSFLKIRGIRKLAQSKDRDARRILREFLASKPPPELVEATEEAIEELEKYFNLIDSVKLVDRKQTAIDMEEKERERALKVFDDKIQILASRLSKEKSEYVRATLVKEIGRFKNVFTIDILIAYLQDPDDRVRANTVEALTMIRSPLIIPHIAPLLSDPNGRVKANVLKALWTFGSHEIYPYLEKMMATGSPAEKKSALFVLKNIKTVDSYRLVKESLNDPDMEVSETARKLLPEFGLIGLTSLIEGPLAFAKSRAVLVAVGSLLLVIIVFTVTIYLMSGPEDIPKKIIITRRSSDGVKRIVHRELAPKLDKTEEGGRAAGFFENFDCTPVNPNIPSDPYDRMQWYANNNVYYCEALTAFGTKDFVLTRDLLLKALEEDPENLWLQAYCLTMLSNCYTELGDKEQAQKAFDKASEYLQTIFDAKGIETWTPKAYSDTLNAGFSSVGEAWKAAGQPAFGNNQ